LEQYQAFEGLATRVARSPGLVNGVCKVLIYRGWDYGDIALAGVKGYVGSISRVSYIIDISFITVITVFVYIRTL